MLKISRPNSTYLVKSLGDTVLETDIFDERISGKDNGGLQMSLSVKVVSSLTNCSLDTTLLLASFGNAMCHLEQFSLKQSINETGFFVRCGKASFLSTHKLEEKLRRLLMSDAE
mgnify:CR=1 FL=1